jgi:hypothetical protein
MIKFFHCFLSYLFLSPNGGAQLLVPAGMPFCLTTSHTFAKSMTASKSAAAICSTSLFVIDINTFWDSAIDIV